MDALSKEQMSGPHVVVMPYPGRGHINPMMHLCSLLASMSDDILLTFVVTEEWLGLLAGTKPPPKLRFRTIPNVVPSEHERAADLPGFIDAVMTKMAAPFERLLDRLEPPASIIFTDAYQAWAVKVGNMRNIPVASFWTQSAAVFSLLQHFDLLVNHQHFPADSSDRGNERVDYIPGVDSIRIADLPTILSPNHPRVVQQMLEAFKWDPKPHFLLFTSIYELEPQTVDALRNHPALPPIHTIGPTIPYLGPQNDVAQPLPEYFRWLDAQPAGSVLYVSMGSFFPLPAAQTKEIAAGLRDCGVRYLWTARGETFQEQQGGGGMGLVVPWCDQLGVLCHPSVGGFWTHCGWSSTVEGAFAGVPMLTFPMIADQTTNSKTVVEDWKIGWRLRGERVGGLVPRGEIAGLVRRLMDSEDGEVKEMRERAQAVRDRCRRAIREGGSSETNLRTVIEKVWQCHDTRHSTLRSDCCG